MGVPLLSHLGSTLIFPGRVIRQLDALQDIPAEADRLPCRIQWPTPHPRPLQDSYRSERFTVNGTLAPYSASTKSEHFPPRQHTWLGFIHRDRRRHSGPRPT
ncbi:hypothetical protein CDL15_Pgr001027 [Punica granatum]|uniref:Uncharacterized protein n=1 Tax=Punica granatum TaxID=22663 RepID=A0A218X0N3_PUNGR|nr:hypothetical protein CDL15_Pgr001027 [Punica granatum]